MPKVVNAELLDQLGRPTEMVDEMLDRQIEALETQLGLRTQGVGNRVLGMFLVNGTRVQLSESQIQQELQRQIGLDEGITSRIVKNLSEAGILRITAAGRYEIANSFLAQRANQKVEAENRVLRTIRATIQDRMSRDELLDRQYLNYIDSSLPLIDLTAEEKAFVKRSRENVRRRRRRFNTIIAAAFVLLAAMAVNTYLNYQSARRNNAEFQQANEELNQSRVEERRLREEAQAALQQAQAATAAAEEALSLAEKAQLAAERSAQEAERQRVLADQLRGEAVQDRNRILAQAERLKELTEQAQRDAQRSEALRQQAEASERMAQLALEKAETLNRIINSWNAASRALQIEDARTKTLVALEAYRLNRDNPGPGDVYHPNIFRALQDAALSFDEQLQFHLPPAHSGSIRDIIVDPATDRIYTAGQDGHIRQWRVRSWNQLGVPELEESRNLLPAEKPAWNGLALSPDGQRLLAGGAGSDFQVFQLPAGRPAAPIPIEPREEILALTYTGSGDFLAAGSAHFFRYTTADGQLRAYPKAPATEHMVVRSESATLLYSVQGQYREFAYELQIDSIGRGVAGRREINFYGTPQEVDYGPVSQVAYHRFSREAALLAIGFSSGRVLLIETTTTGGDDLFPRSGDARKDFKPHQAEITDFAFDHEGKQLAVASVDGSVSIWNLQRYSDPSYQPVVLGPHAVPVRSVAFARSGAYLLAGTHNGQLYFWNTRPENYAEFLCERLEATGSAAREQQLKLESISRKSGLTRAFDELSAEDYRRYFGEGESRRLLRSIRVCN